MYKTVQNIFQQIMCCLEQLFKYESQATLTIYQRISSNLRNM